MSSDNMSGRQTDYHLYENFFGVLAITPNELTSSKQNAIVNGGLRPEPTLNVLITPFKSREIL